MATLIALILGSDNTQPDREMQRKGDLVAKAAAGDQQNIMFVYTGSRGNNTLYDLMTGFGPTATLVPDQITTLSGLDLPDPQRFVLLGELMLKNEKLAKPRHVVAVIADAGFIRSFLRYYIPSIADNPLAASLIDVMSFGDPIGVDTETRTIVNLRQ